MSGETDLSRLLASLTPILDPVEYAFDTVADVEPPFDNAFALIREAEAVTLIRPGKGWARITLQVYSSLAAVGLTARVSESLATHGISANMVAAFHHDHIFVPWERRDEALKILENLAKGHTKIGPGMPA